MSERPRRVWGETIAMPDPNSFCSGAKAPLIPEVPSECVRLSTQQERWLASTRLTLEEMAALQKENAQPELEPDPVILWTSSLK